MSKVKVAVVGYGDLPPMMAPLDTSLEPVASKAHWLLPYLLRKNVFLVAIQTWVTPKIAIHMLSEVGESG